MPQLIIMRHGNAEPIVNSDASRSLTAEGEQNCIKAANALLAQFSHIAEQVQIFHSPYRRTTQTAVLLAETLTAVHDQQLTVVESDILLSEQSPGTVIKWLLQDEVAADKSRVLVSHQPLVSSLVAFLVEGAGDYASMRNYPMWPASVAVLDIKIIGTGCAELLSLNHYAN